MNNLELVKLSLIFRVVIIIVIYFIIFYAMKAINKDIKIADKVADKRNRRLGLRVINIGPYERLKNNQVIMITGLITIGRKEGNTIVLKDPYISSHHARIYKDESEYIIEDLGSTNGTYLNGNPIVNRAFLDVGDIIKLGDFTVKVVE